jgi:hypothetical protein
MIRSLGRSHPRVWLLAGLAALGGCTSGPDITLVNYETPLAYVRLEMDRTVVEGPGHTHPADISPELMSSVLRGIIVQEPLTRFPLYDDLSVPRRHRAFSDEEIAFWAPLLALALSKATPEEVVTFYQTRRLSGVRREVTSGGLFLEGDALHVLLSNYRSHTHPIADIGVADTMDDRLTPMRPLAPQTGVLDFEPREALTPVDRGLLRWDRRELIIRVPLLATGDVKPGDEDRPTGLVH